MSTTHSIRPVRSRHLIFAAALAASAGAFAGADALPPVQTQGSVRYVTGGIGVDESDAIKAQFGSYSLALTFAVQNPGRDAFVSSVAVKIRDDAGNTVLDATSDGPYLLADLPAGTYRVEATYKGVLKTASAKIAAGGHQRSTIVWPDPTRTVSQPRPAAPAPPPPANLPPVNTQGGIPYVSGGIGEGESAAIKAAAPRYSLSVMLAGRREGRDAYLASVPVTVRDAAGSTVLNVVTDGPFLLADLPPGSYKVTGVYNGIEKTLSVMISAGSHAQASFLWNDEGATPAPTAPTAAPAADPAAAPAATP